MKRNMENLELRKKVAEALGCKPQIGPFFDSPILVCRCPDYEHGSKEQEYFNDWIPSYELDHHAALDAIREFCKRKDLRYTIDEYTTFSSVSVCISKYRTCSVLANVLNPKFTTAICEAIVKAAEKAK